MQGVMVLGTGVHAPLQTLNSLIALKPFSLLQQFCLEKGIIKHQPSEVSSPVLILITATVKCYSVFACRMVSIQRTVLAVQVRCILIH